MNFLSFDWLYSTTYYITKADFFRLFPQLAADLFSAKNNLSKIEISSIRDCINKSLDVSRNYFPSLLIDANLLTNHSLNHFFPENDILLSFCKNHGQRIEEAVNDDLFFLMISFSLFKIMLKEEKEFSWTYGTSIDDILDKIEAVKTKESFDRILKAFYIEDSSLGPSKVSTFHYLETPFLFALHKSTDPSKNPYAPRVNSGSRIKHLVPKSFFSSFKTVPITEQDVKAELTNFVPSDTKDQAKVGELITRYSAKAIATINQYFIEYYTAIDYLNLLSTFKDDKFVLETLKRYLLSPLFKTRTAIIQAAKDELLNGDATLKKRLQDKNEDTAQKKELHDEQVKSLMKYINYLYDAYTYIVLPSVFLSFTILSQLLEEEQNDNGLNEIISYFKDEYSEENAIKLKSLMNKEYNKNSYDFFENCLHHKILNKNYLYSRKLYDTINESYFSTTIKNLAVQHNKRFTIDY